MTANNFPVIVNGGPVDANTWFNPMAQAVTQLQSQQASVTRVGFKTLNETVNNSSALQNDDQLFATVDANTRYFFTGRFVFTSNATPDIKFGFTYPSGATASYTLFGTGAGGTVLAAFNFVETNIAALEGGTAVAGTMLGSWTIGTTPGVIQLQWAQNVANATDTIVLAGSFIRFDSMLL